MYLFELVDTYLYRRCAYDKKKSFSSFHFGKTRESFYCDLRKEFLCNKNKIGFLWKSFYVSPEPAVSYLKHNSCLYYWSKLNAIQKGYKKYMKFMCDNYVPQWGVELDDELSCLLKDSELFILLAENSQILLKIYVIPILLTFIYLVAINL